MPSSQRSYSSRVAATSPGEWPGVVGPRFTPGQNIGCVAVRRRRRDRPALDPCRKHQVAGLPWLEPHVTLAAAGAHDEDGDARHEGGDGKTDDEPLNHRG